MNNYFSHDSNSRNSDKLIPLRARFGVEGYGIYFMILERLREEPDYVSIKDYNMLAFDLRVDAAKVKAVIEGFGLFAFTDDGKCFYSDSFLRRMREKDIKSEKARKSALSRWGDATAMRSDEKSMLTKKREKKDISTQDKSFVDDLPVPKKGRGCEYENPPEVAQTTKPEKRSCAKRERDDLSFVEPPFRPVMEVWTDYKDERGEGYKKQGLVACYAQLRELSNGSPEVARKIIQNSMANNYAGIFQLKTPAASPLPATAYHHDKSTTYEQF